jgi:hypothetical protein
MRLLDITTVFLNARRLLVTYVGWDIENHLSEMPTIRPLGFNLQNMAFLKRAVEKMLCCPEAGFVENLSWNAVSEACWGPSIFREGLADRERHTDRPSESVKN